MEKIKQLRDDIYNLLKEKDVNYSEWNFIVAFIEQRYETIKEKSTL